MKFFLALSIILNGVLLYLYLEEKNQPPIERIIMETHERREVTATSKKDSKLLPELKESITPIKPGVSDLKTKSKKDKNAAFAIIGDEVSFDRAAYEMDLAKKDFFDKIELPEEKVEKKTEIMSNFYNKSGEYYKKNKSSMGMSFKDRRELLNMEEQAHSQIEKIYGKEKWQKYKDFVDGYNNKLINGYNTGEYNGPLMGY